MSSDPERELESKDDDDDNGGMSIVTREQLETFKRDGVVVIPNVLTPEELEEIRADFDATIQQRFGFDPTSKASIKATIDNLTDKEVKGGIVHVYWAQAQLKVMQHPKIVAAITDLYAKTFSAQEEEVFEHSHGDFNPHRAYWYADRACYRLPDMLYDMSTKSRRIYGSGPHVDVNPWEMKRNSGLNKVKWRPIQGFLALTPNLEPSTGGFMAVKGFHQRFNSYFEEIPEYTSGEFVRITSEYSSELLKEFQEIVYDEGSLVFWDYRTPHMTTPQHKGQMTRKVIYANYLPDTSMNRRYAKDQLSCFESNSTPPDFRKGAKKVSDCNVKPEEFSFTELGEKLMGIRSWKDK
eukprot:TRINITY_DN1499_c0_g2_i1.p1 TRINITY_DN1499_c0_g2~~TRINITY_DN1499_c0_g2_i1.p1  ORF type:complete len:351 (+),score=84.06 TRINITY_DN1499_c0_g2_i1:632-1684(+)